MHGGTHLERGVVHGRVAHGTAGLAHRSAGTHVLHALWQLTQPRVGAVRRVDPHAAVHGLDVRPSGHLVHALRRARPVGARARPPCGNAHTTEGGEAPYKRSHEYTYNITARATRVRRGTRPGCSIYRGGRRAARNTPFQHRILPDGRRLELGRGSSDGHDAGQHRYDSGSLHGDGRRREKHRSGACGERRCGEGGVAALVGHMSPNRNEHNIWRVPFAAPPLMCCLG